MFTWICPQCGREVPPSYTECPDCAAAAAGTAAAPPPASPNPPMQPVYQGPPPPQQGGMQPQPQPQQPYPYPQYPPPYQPQQPSAYQQPVYQQPQYPPPPYAQPQYQQPVYQQPQYQQPLYQQPVQAAPPPPPPPPPVTMREPEPVDQSTPAASTLFAASQPPPERTTGGMPTWLLTILCTAGFALLIGGIYWLVGSSHKPATPSSSVESPAAKPGAATNPWQKFIEVSGVRLMEDPKHKGHILAKFIVTNHASEELSGLAGNVTIWASTKKSDEDAEGTFSFITNIAGFETKEITSPLTTKLKVYELPDWTNMTTDLQITAPSALSSGGQP